MRRVFLEITAEIPTAHRKTFGGKRHIVFATILNMKESDMVFLSPGATQVIGITPENPHGENGSDTSTSVRIEIMTLVMMWDNGQIVRRGASAICHITEKKEREFKQFVTQLHNSKNFHVKTDGLESVIDAESIKINREKRLLFQ